jgi:hypothetical protein
MEEIQKEGKNKIHGHEGRQKKQSKEMGLMCRQKERREKTGKRKYKTKSEAKRGQDRRE